MVNEMSGGMRVTRASVSDRKIRISRTMMNSSDSCSTFAPVLPEAFCWSTAAATSPARCACSPAGSPALAILARSAFTRSSSAFGLPPFSCEARMTSCAACPSGETPASITLLTSGTDFSCSASAATAVWSAAVSGAAVRAATSGIGIRPAVPNGSASTAACSLGALAGRNLVLLLWVTLDSAGSCVAAAIAAMTHARTTSHRNPTAKRPMAPKIASIRIVTEPT